MITRASIVTLVILLAGSSTDSDASGRTAAAQARAVSPDSLRRTIPAGPRPVKNWPVILGNSISYMPAVADIDGDGRDEIAVGIKDCRVFLLDSDGRKMPGWPRETAAWIARGPMLEDIDGDGKVG